MTRIVINTADRATPEELRAAIHAANARVLAQFVAGLPSRARIDEILSRVTQRAWEAARAEAGRTGRPL